MGTETVRLFAAIEFDDATRESVWENSSALREHCTRGNFVPIGNYHITLSFIGETSRLSEAKESVLAADGETFVLTLCGIGKFERTRGDTYWLGVKENIALSALAGNVERELKLRGFLTEKRTFRPHVTLARDVRLYRDIRTKTPEINYSVTGFSLMRSDRIGGRMKYSTVAHKEFKK